VVVAVVDLEVVAAVVVADIEIIHFLAAVAVAVAAGEAMMVVLIIVEEIFATNPINHHLLHRPQVLENLVMVMHHQVVVAA